MQHHNSFKNVPPLIKIISQYTRKMARNKYLFSVIEMNYTRKSFLNQPANVMSMHKKDTWVGYTY